MNGGCALPSGWTTKTLGVLLANPQDLSYGIVQPGPHVADGVPIVRVTDIRHGRVSVESPLRVSSSVEASFSRSRLRGGELLITLVGTVGECAVAPIELRGWNTARAVGVARIGPEVGAYWLQLCLRSQDVQNRIAARVNTTVQTTLNLRDLRELPVVLPPPGERRRISELLESLDTKIESNRRVHRLAWELIESSYTDLVRESETVPLSSLLALEYGKALPGPARVPGPVPVFGSGGPTGAHDTALIDGPAVVVGRKGTVGSLYWSSVPCWPIDTTFFVRPADGIPMLAAYMALRRAGLSDMNSDSAVPGLNRGAALAAEVMSPLVPGLDRWAGDSDLLVSLARGADGQNVKLVALRDGLSPELLSGRIRVPEAAEAVDSALD